MLSKSKKIESGDIVVAKYQYGGRGQNNNKWYCYDDLKSKLVYIGNYFKMLDINPCPKKNGVLYFYNE